MLAVSTEDGTLTLYDIENGQPVYTNKKSHAGSRVIMMHWTQDTSKQSNLNARSPFYQVWMNSNDALISCQNPVDVFLAPLKSESSNLTSLVSITVFY
jgi:hypothetical protein